MWEIAIKVNNRGAEPVTGILLLLGYDQFVVEIPQDIERILKQNSASWDYLADDLQTKAGDGLIRIFIEDADLQVKLAELTDALQRLKAQQGSAYGALTWQKKLLDASDWSQKWKEFYLPISIDDKILICPSWLADDALKAQARLKGQRLLMIDPANSFGTGQHATTRLCLQLLPKANQGDVLDMGCGSGILGLAALSLGYRHLTAVDIEDAALEAVAANAALNGLDQNKIQLYCGNALTDAKLKEQLQSERYDLIFANIVADVIIAMAPLLVSLLAKAGILIVSGVIAPRQSEVAAALAAAGLRQLQGLQEDDWLASSWEVAAE